MTCSFQSANDGWVAGSSGSTESLLLHTTNGGRNLTNTPQDVSGAMWMSVRFSKDGRTGITAGLGSSLINAPVAEVTTNSGKFWNATNSKLLFSVSQSVDVIDNQNLVIAGSWATALGDGADGIQLSSDAGETWAQKPWTSDTSVRYCSGVNPSTVFVTGGMWPSTDEQTRSVSENGRQLSRHLFVDPQRQEMVWRQARTQRSAVDSPLEGYQAVISLTTDAGLTWTELVNDPNQGYYFNQIDCVSQRHCIVVGEGADASGASVAYVWSTDDGFKSTTKTTVPNASLMAVSSLNSTHAWIGGAQPSPTGGAAALFMSTVDGGKTWRTAQSSLNDFAVTDISTVSGNAAFAAGITRFGLSSLAGYGPVDE
eukprot:CAMPEP_0201559894 /NCGR_PEP_ID=MMETSP0173_2-20130828/77016_1 /ASSEMBLY_ACC=CAM_ASM_000268 /TAXON_ID=218659 /ORGANISM="Vexillifera sp., Strain DIVA3 564/2" /LENGTH=368 /DNA_ID=CAMNT_0047974245 /DNA_START=104 /DNA_END=1210 /DNA_ORIENTATION=+